MPLGCSEKFLIYKQEGDPDHHLHAGYRESVALHLYRSSQLSTPCGTFRPYLELCKDHARVLLFLFLVIEKVYHYGEVSMLIHHSCMPNANRLLHFLSFLQQNVRHRSVIDDVEGRPVGAEFRNRCGSPAGGRGLDVDREHASAQSR